MSLLHANSLKVLLTVFVSLVFEQTVVADPSMLIVLKSSAAVRSAFVEIGDISSIPNDPHRLRSRASRVLLGMSPEEGVVREISRDDVRERLQLAGLDIEKIRLEGEEHVTVFRASERVEVYSDTTDRESRRSRMVNDERSVMTIFGEVSSQDVDQRSRMVRSERIADLKVVFLGTGPVSRNAGRAWVSWLLEYLWPF